MSENPKRYLGELVIAFAHLEDTLSEGLAQILSLNYDDSKIIFDAVSFKKKIQIINALLRKYQDRGVRQYVYTLLSKANELEDRRNMFIHSDWEYFIKPKHDSKSNIVLKRKKLRYKRKNSAEVFIEEFGSTELNKLKEIIKELEECSHDLYYEFCEIGSHNIVESIKSANQEMQPIADKSGSG